MKKLKQLIMVFIMAVVLSSCMTLTHTVGEGAKSGATIQKRQWYALWGLIPINPVDSKTLAGGATSYTVTSQVTVTDWFLNIFTSIVTIYSQTVEVQK